jgi:protein tyrosine phosphatase (PTP) superfamily phosphohydrolase (DUF442 family)
LVFIVAAAGCQSKADAPAVPTRDDTGEIRRLDVPGLHNLFRVSDRLYSGSSPDGDTGFAGLAKLGIKTVISVDGAKPDVDAARRHGLTYVHLPFGYDGIPRDRLFGLAKAATTLPGPIYVHCHHGQHRGPAAVAAMQLCTDPTWDAAKGEAWLKSAGTDPRYVGLIGLPRLIIRPTTDELAKVRVDFPAVATIPDLARLMVNVDAHWDNLKLIKAAGWATPKDQPDVDPQHEAVQLAENFREAARLHATRQRGADFARMLATAEAAAAGLETELRTKPVKADRASAAFAKSAAACTACHGKYRDRPTAAERDRKD